MNKNLLTTADGSHTFEISGSGLTYHSRHGALTESMHVFIRAGLLSTQAASLPKLQILEIGLGTGLNAFLTLLQSGRENRHIQYTALEKFPLAAEEAAQLNYPALLGEKELFMAIHTCGWEKDIMISKKFTLYKTAQDIHELLPVSKSNLVYFDAFDPGAQPELWTEAVFQKIYDLMDKNGVLVTYSAKGGVRRALQSAGFSLERLPGPPGKREMIRALKV